MGQRSGPGDQAAGRRSSSVSVPFAIPNEMNQGFMEVTKPAFSGLHLEIFTECWSSSRRGCSNGSGRSLALADQASPSSGASSYSYDVEDNISLRGFSAW